MNTEFAGRNENQSGQRFLDSSDPRLIRHAASGEAAGEFSSSPAGKDQKLSRGPGGRATGRGGLCGWFCFCFCFSLVRL